MTPPAPALLPETGAGGRPGGSPAGLPEESLPEDSRSEESGPNRRCVATGRVLPKERLIRFVVAPDGTVTPDLAGRLPGRGLWVAAERAALERAVAKTLLARAAQRAAAGSVPAGAITVPAGLADQVDALLAARCLELIGLARRAGQAVAGFEKVRSWLAEGRVAVVLEAADGAEAGRSKLAALAAGRPVIDLFDAAALGAALGRDIAVHAALAPGGLAKRLVVEAARLAGLRRGAGLGEGGRNEGGRHQGGRPAEAGARGRKGPAKPRKGTPPRTTPGTGGSGAGEPRRGDAPGRLRRGG